MKSTKFRSDNQEHGKQLLEILLLWQECRIEAERECRLCGLIEIRLEDVCIEHGKPSKDTELVLIRGVGTDVCDQLVATHAPLRNRRSTDLVRVLTWCNTGRS